MTHRPRSILVRSMLGFAAVLGLIWLVLIGLLFFEAAGDGQAGIDREVRYRADAIMVISQALATQPIVLRRALEDLQTLHNRERQERHLPGDMLIQVWQGQNLLFGDPRVPTLRPAPGQANVRIEGTQFQGWTRSEVSADMTVRVLTASAQSLLIHPGSLMFVLGPLIVCLPLLVVPAWLVLRFGFAPLKSVCMSLEAGSAHRLELLPPTPYRELMPVVDAINQLIRRLQQRLEADKVFFADAAHALKTPLAVVHVEAQNLVSADINGLAASRERARQGLERGLERASRAVAQILALSRCSTGTSYGPGAQIPAGGTNLSRISSDLVELIRVRVACILPLADSYRVGLAVEGVSTVMIPGDSEALGILIDNVLENAVRHSPPGGEVKVTVDINSQPDACFAVVRFEDQGPGVPAALREHVFERFVHGIHHDFPGTGLGLAVVRQAAMLHSGSAIFVDPPSGRGACLVVTLPIDQQKVRSAP